MHTTRRLLLSTLACGMAYALWALLDRKQRSEKSNTRGLCSEDMTWIDPLSRRLHQNAGRHGPVILVYHSVTSGNRTPHSPLAVSMKQFCAHLDFLASEGYVMPTVRELVTAPAATWVGATAVMTFDDGYLDNLAAYEALQERGMRATWFVVTGSIGQVPKWPPDGRPEGRLLNVAELRQMQENGMEIGSHAVNHVHLTESDDAHLVHELTDSRTTLENMLSRGVTSFAYPYGAWDERCAKAVEQAGYSSACTTRSGWALLDNDPYKLRRLSVFNTDTVNTLARKLAFADNKVNWSQLSRYALRRIMGR
jgi:peptidoglycan/xylan/chitin deacetylase (PgdA/CDA1 family)